MLSFIIISLYSLFTLSFSSRYLFVIPVPCFGELAVQIVRARLESSNQLLQGLVLIVHFACTVQRDVLYLLLKLRTASLNMVIASFAINISSFLFRR